MTLAADQRTRAALMTRRPEVMTEGVDGEAALERLCEESDNTEVTEDEFMQILVNWKTAREGINKTRLARKFPEKKLKGLVQHMI